MGRHSYPGGSRHGKKALAIALTAISVGAGIFLISWGNHLAARDYYYSVLPWGFWGAVLISAPFLCIAAVAVSRLARMLGRDVRQYQAWKRTLPPEQRAAVELAEIAALTVAAIAAHERHRRRDAELTESVMGRARRR